MSRHRFHLIAFAIGSFALFPGLARAADEPDPVIQALTAELQRSMGLQLEDLSKPYFIEYSVDDVTSQRISASYGALIASDQGRSRRLHTQVRVGGYDLDNTNYAGGGFGRGMRFGGRGAGTMAALPIDDDTIALRQAIWRATDDAYKSAVETLTEKRAYMEGLDLGKRPKDFTPHDAVQKIAPRVALTLDGGAWGATLEKVSKRFNDYAFIQDSSVDLTARARNRYLVNSEGTKIRDGDVELVLTVHAEVQADDGQRIADRLEYRAASAKELPTEEALLHDVEGLASRLHATMKAPRLEDYDGPVLFEGHAAAQIFQELIASGVAGQPDPVGMERRRFRGGENLSKKLGKRILPAFFHVYDDPQQAMYEGEALAGHYAIDDEGVPAQRVDLVEKGKLTHMVMSRVPTDDFDATNGHGRRGLGGGTRASVGCLFIESSKGKSEAELRQAILDAAKDQGLEYALVISSLGANRAAGFGGFGRGRRGGRRFGGGRGGGFGGGVSDPLAVSRLYVADGHEEPVRACEFASLDVGALRDIVAAGSKATVLNTANRGVPISIVAPSFIIDETELVGIEAEPPSKPELPPPHARKS